MYVCCIYFGWICFVCCVLRKKEKPPNPPFPFSLLSSPAAHPSPFPFSLAGPSASSPAFSFGPAFLRPKRHRRPILPFPSLFFFLPPQLFPRHTLHPPSQMPSHLSLSPTSGPHPQPHPLPPAGRRLSHGRALPL
jgi:hypothetical protein